MLEGTDQIQRKRFGLRRKGIDVLGEGNGVLRRSGMLERESTFFIHFLVVCVCLVDANSDWMKESRRVGMRWRRAA